MRTPSARCWRFQRRTARHRAVSQSSKLSILVNKMRGKMKKLAADRGRAASLKKVRQVDHLQVNEDGTAPIERRMRIVVVIFGKKSSVG